jgi:uncharacterized protein
MRIFDVQLHAFESLEGFRHASSQSFGAHAKTANAEVREPGEHLHKTIEFMDANNVTAGVVSGDNRAVQQWRVAHPERFLASYRPDLSLPDLQASADTFDQEAEQGLWHGLGELTLPYDGLPLNDPVLDPFLTICERRKLPVAYHTGLDGPAPMGSFRVEQGDPLLLQEVVHKFPDLNIIIMHLGWPFFDHALYMMYAFPNVYGDLGVINWILGRAVFHRMLHEAVDTVGSERLLFGSDQMAWPQMITPAVDAVLSAGFLSEVDRRNILWNNAARIYPIPARPHAA